MAHPSLLLLLVLLLLLLLPQIHKIKRPTFFSTFAPNSATLQPLTNSTSNSLSWRFTSITRVYKKPFLAPKAFFKYR